MKQEVVPILFDTYLAMIRNSVGTNMFRNNFAMVDGVRQDITNNGDLSCAWFVSSILMIFSLIQRPHAAVDGMVKDLEASGWERIDAPEVGCVLVWEKDPDHRYRHVGFFMGEETAISNNYKLGHPAEHHWTCGAEGSATYRRIEAMYRHARLQRTDIA